MKTRIMIEVAFIFLFSVVTASAMNFDVRTLEYSGYGQDYCFTIQIYMDNDASRRTGMSIPLTFYMTGDIQSWKVISYRGLNGFESDSPNWGYWNEFWTRGGDAWDGYIADTINWTGSGPIGMLPDQPLLPRFEYKIRIGYPGNFMDEGLFCVDSCSIPYTPSERYDWLFENPSPSFGGPYCWKASFPPCWCADIHNDGAINLLDITHLINYLYKDGPPPESCFPDVNGLDCAVNILDISYLINYLYKGGPPPQC